MVVQFQSWNDLSIIKAFPRYFVCEITINIFIYLILMSIIPLMLAQFRAICVKAGSCNSYLKGVMRDM
jgi:hypothetical protein